ncbi:MAG: hypothetical protein QXT36_03910, partial [Candidatus Micrarchaeaceae archaeon]
LKLEFSAKGANYSIEASMNLISATGSNSTSITLPASFSYMQPYSLALPNATINSTSIETIDEEVLALYATNPQPNFMHYIVMTEMAYALGKAFLLG